LAAPPRCGALRLPEVAFCPTVFYNCIFEALTGDFVVLQTTRNSLQRFLFCGLTLVRKVELTNAGVPDVTAENQR
jgi:hypothetical protein